MTGPQPWSELPNGNNQTLSRQRPRRTTNKIPTVPCIGRARHWQALGRCIFILVSIRSTVCSYVNYTPYSVQVPPPHAGRTCRHSPHYPIHTDCTRDNGLVAVWTNAGSAERSTRRGGDEQATRIHPSEMCSPNAQSLTRQDEGSVRQVLRCEVHTPCMYIRTCMYIHVQPFQIRLVFCTVPPHVPRE